MRVLENQKKFLSPQKIFNALLIRLFPFWMRMSRFVPSDKLYLRVFYRLAMHEKLDLKNPKTYTQKVQWLKLHNTDPLYSKMVDKYEVRKIIANKIGEEYLIPLLGVWDKFEYINFELLPNEFVLKTTHDSGTVIICKDKKSFDIVSARKILNRALRTNYFYKSREYPYKNAMPRIIAEKYMHDEKQTELDDYKFFCFKGEPKFLSVTTNKGGDKGRGFFDLDLNPMPFTESSLENVLHKIKPPNNFNEMIDVAKILSKNITHVRIDLYNISGKVFFGEYTFHNAGGLVHFKPQKANYEIGQLIELPFKY